jgi:hypothetical protein
MRRHLSIEYFDVFQKKTWSRPCTPSWPQRFNLEKAVNAKTPRGKDAKGREMGRERQA